jgi:hypothetical protein
VLIQEQGKAKTHLFLWTTAFALGLWGFWTRASWWAEALTAVLTVWAWAGAAASARALKYGFYDIENPDSPEEAAIARKSSWLSVPIVTLAVLLWLKHTTQ